LNLSAKYIYRAIQEGRLEARKTGKQLLITREDVRRFWESLPRTSQQKSSEV
jgi:excisionase family DNA binding protein